MDRVARHGAPRPMRTLIRGLAATALVVALGLGIGAGPWVSSVSAASPLASAMSSAGFDVDDEWCVDHGTTYDCTVVQAILIVTSGPDGRDIAHLTYRQVVTSFGADGAQIGHPRAMSMDRTVFVGGGQDVTFSVSHTRTASEVDSCVSTSLFKIVAGDLVVDRYAGPGC